jgi:2,3-bisphosphoglycerate-independent phosphoglycerate mutase
MSGLAPVPAVCLVILDGWGIAAPGPGNAVELASTPVFDRLWAAYPHTTLVTCGRAVGLPDGQMGNSEVGHLNLGAGSVVRQDLTRIDDAVADGTLAANEVLRAALGRPERVHLLGLASHGGVHSSLQHLLALVELADKLGEADLVVHAFTDGRDTGPHDGLAAIEELEQQGVRIASVVGRYFAMDRDKRWDRIQKAYDLLVHARAEHRAESASAAVAAAYERGETDEFVEPTVIGMGAPITAGDAVLCFNFRPDRMREIVQALADPAFTEIDRGGAEPVRDLSILTEYEEGWPYPVAFKPERPEITLGAVIAASDAAQLHVAETEKYPHVTYFFNGGEESPLPGERRELVPSPRDVPTYDQKPEMSARAATDAFCAAWAADAPRFAIINFANPDMVGHTGVIAAAVRAVETVDQCLARVLAAVHESGGVCIVTADHGNAEEMLTAEGTPQTAHSLNPVPMIVTRHAVTLAPGGVLADVAPTVLDLLGLAQPREMTGRSLLV